MTDTMEQRAREECFKLLKVERDYGHYEYEIRCHVGHGSGLANTYNAPQAMAKFATQEVNAAIREIAGEMEKSADKWDDVGNSRVGDVLCGWVEQLRSRIGE